jgi:hypothetical protein
MSRKPKISPLPERERNERLQEFLAVLNEHPELVHLRAAVPPGPDRQLALFAALEREVIMGDPLLCPPQPDDLADIILCDILAVIDRDPKLKNHGAYYGPYRRLANLQALGVWKGNKTPAKPVALELFATLFSHPTADATSTCPSSAGNLSPRSQESAPNGDLIVAAIELPAAGSEVSDSSQAEAGQSVAAIEQDELQAAAAEQSRGIIRHAAPMGGEQLGGEQCGEQQSSDLALDPRQIAPRPVRRGRLPVLDDLAKGRLLGLMSYGLSFRQAAAQLGVHHQTLLNLMKRDEPFAQQVAEARLDAISQPLLTVVQASRTNWRAAAWLARFLEERRVRNIESTPEERELQNQRQK